MKDYEVKIVECSKDLTVRERIQLKDTSASTGLNNALTEIEAQGGNALEITPIMWAALSVHNEYAADNQDYTVYILKADNGVTYSTSSESFWRSFTGIVEELQADGDCQPGTFSVLVYHQISKKNVNKLLLCSLV